MFTAYGQFEVMHMQILRQTLWTGIEGEGNRVTCNFSDSAERMIDSVHNFLVYKEYIA